MLRHVYQAAPQKLQLVLRALMEDEELDIGLKFEQQVKGSDSVPDALITQPPLAVLVEAKRGNDITVGQIEGHLKSFEAMGHTGGNQRYLLVLTGGMVPSHIRDQYEEAAVAHGIQQISATFDQLLKALKGATGPIDYALNALNEVIDDFEALLRSEGVVRPGLSMVAFAATKSSKENLAC